ncbi:MAG: hypothetical protein MUF53_13200 [Gemmatimonadaceae bacterium]|nr:hypothetical protein [Gemmatimonadaceae bacterium]
MAGDISGADGRVAQHYGTIAVVGGGCYGRYYVRQLRRAARAGAISWRRLDVVDRDPACLATRDADWRNPAGTSPAPRLVAAEWRTYFARAIPDAQPDDAVVPSPLMPHLMVEWLLDRVAARWPERTAGLRALAAPLEVPWQLANGDAPHYASFATWTCPVNCIEPARCPHTRGPRDWSMPPTAAAYVAARRAAGEPLDGPLVFHCEHRARLAGSWWDRRPPRPGRDIRTLIGRSG